MSYQCWSTMHHYHNKLPDYKVYFQSDIYEGESSNSILLLAFVRFQYKLTGLCPKNDHSICPLEDVTTSLVTKYPYITSNTNSEQCTLLLLLNLAKPQWIPVGCHDKLVNHVVCFAKKEDSNNSHTLGTSKTYICKRTSILYKRWCFVFFACVSKACTISNIISTCGKLNLFNVFDDEKSLNLLNVIYEAISLHNIYFAVLNKGMRNLYYFYAKRNMKTWMGNAAIIKSNNSKNGYTHF